ncbi:MAG: 5'/3'-nucleotidase SurE [Spirochaetes bacterium]|nr:5'/3'-nucleotidase SurE [Spirochaetota bacterium]MBU0956152.1 5'/3'-nucleotidase SurE [Spirochaetota bacterium]
MKILLTNDDGYNAEGLLVLAKVLRRSHEVCIFAPDRERSAQSHAMTLRDPLTVTRIDTDYYSCSGTPVDCVLLCSHKAIPFQPELVISGINRGPNLGTDLIYSGTAAAARQAAMLGLPGIAVSLASFKPPFNYSALAEFVHSGLASLQKQLRQHSFLNINAPSAPDGTEYTAVWTTLSRRIYEDTLRIIETKGDHHYCMYTDGRVHSQPQEGSDDWAISQGFASLSLVAVYPQTFQVDTEGLS